MTDKPPIRWQPIALVGGIFALYLFSIRPAPIPDGWGTDFDQAIDEATTTGRNLLVAFNMAGCPPCSMMDEYVIPDSRVQVAAAGFVRVRVSLDRQPDLAGRFEVFGTPTYLVIRPDGTTLNRVSGFVPADEFLAFLAQASTASAARSP